MIDRLYSSIASDAPSLVWQLKYEFVEQFVQKPKVRNRKFVWIQLLVIIVMDV